jgi:hypothetical protein
MNVLGKAWLLAAPLGPTRMRGLSFEAKQSTISVHSDMLDGLLNADGLVIIANNGHVGFSRFDPYDDVAACWKSRNIFLC